MKDAIEHRKEYLVSRIIWVIAWPLLLWFLHSCATPTAPQGGPRDETPPQIIAEESTPNLQTNFEKQTIELTFDEWVILEKIREEVIISPPLSSDPEIKLKRRTVQLIFPDTVQLRENVTYTINFGEAVKDLNEKNPAEDLRFVFSTGEFIDSLSVTGRVVDVQTGEPVEKVLFMLYDNLADSVVYTERPFYFGRTDKDGTFVINNIREGTYKGFALEDLPSAPKKYIFEPNERIAFPDSFIVLSAVDTTADLDLQLFKEKMPLLANRIDTSHFGKVKVIFNQPIFDLEINHERLQVDPIIRQQGDSLVLWYTQATPWTLFVSQDSTFRDTFAISAGKRDQLISRDSMATVKGSSNRVITPGTPPAIGYNHPIASFDTTLITLYVDSLREAVRPVLQLDSLNRQQLLVDHNWRADTPYELELLPGAITDIFGLSTTDTLTISYTLEPVNRFGNILLTLSELDSTETYLVQLMNTELTQTLLSDEVSGLTTYEVDWRVLKPGTYTLRVITDWNRNGRWDTGDYDLGRQPEPIYLRPLEQLRANWDLDVAVIYGEIVAEAEPAAPTSNTSNRPGGRQR